MAGRIGARTAMVGCLGQDSNGDSYIQSLSGDGIDCASVRRDAGAPTGVAQVDGKQRQRESIFKLPSSLQEDRFGG